MREYELRREGKEKEMQERWTVARWMAWQNVLLSPNIKPHNKPKTAQSFCRFPWEVPEADELAEKAKQFRVTAEEEAKLNKIMSDWEASQKKAESNVQDR